MQEIAIGELYFDKISPRFVENFNDSDDESDFKKHLLKSDYIGLANSLAKEGHFESQPLLVVQENGRYVVLDGNRRLAIYQAWCDPVWRLEHKLPQLNITSLPVTVCEYRKIALKDILKRDAEISEHKRPWSLLELRAFLYRYFSNDDDVSSLAQKFGMSEQDFTSMTCCLNFFKSVELPGYDQVIKRNFDCVAKTLKAESFKKETGFFFDGNLRACINESLKHHLIEKTKEILIGLKNNSPLPVYGPEKHDEQTHAKSILLSLNNNLLNKVPLFSTKMLFSNKSFLVSALAHVVVILLLAIFVVTTYYKEKVEFLDITMSEVEEEVTLDIVPPDIENPEEIEISSETVSPSLVSLNNSDNAEMAKRMGAIVDEATNEVPEELESGEQVDVPSLKLTGMSGSMTSRSIAGKATAVKQYGGLKEGQEKLIRALRWLQACQNPDGSWGTSRKHALTGLASMTFMAYGVNGNSKRYGSTLVKGLKWMIKEAEQADDKLGSSGYEHAIATLCIAEACGIMTKSELRYAMEKTVGVILDGQNPDGGFDYDYNATGSSVLTLTGWNCLALKAARTAECENVKLPGALYELAKFLKGRQKGSGFCYSKGTLGKNTGGCGIGSARGIGVLCLQFIDEGDCEEAVKVLDVLLEKDIDAMDWASSKEPLPLYSWYYITQAMFNAGGSHWNGWRGVFQKNLIDNQHSDGYWDHPPESSYSSSISGHNAKVFNTSLSCLMLTVFYRYLPMYKSGKAKAVDKNKQANPDESDIPDFDEALDVLSN